ncbi:MAG: transglutaminase domain-containing protein, partial [Candidatus Altiarchaeum hamiconexum]|nr:transglutaminase domain-containing protein [Candidatus Altarchaeum hamiconexum]
KNNLAVNESMICNCTTTLTQCGNVTNKANVTGKYSGEIVKIVNATANVTVFVACPVTSCNISILNLTFNPKRPVDGYRLNLNVSINSSIETITNLTLKIDENLTESREINLSPGINYAIFTIIAVNGTHNISVYLQPKECDDNWFNTSYNASTPKLLVQRYLNNLTKLDDNMSLNGTQKGIILSPKDNMTNMSFNYSRSLRGYGAKDIGTGKVVMTYKGSITLTSYGNGEISIYVPSAAISDRQSRNVTVRITDNSNTTIDNCDNMHQCTFMHDTHNTETIRIDFTNLAQAQHNLEYEVNITTDVNNFNYTIDSLTNGSNNTYLQNDSLTQWTPEIRNMTVNLTQNCSSDFERVGKISKWVYENIDYDINLAGKSENASWVYTNKKGVCAHYTNLLISMCRSIGIPARGVYGEVYNSSLGSSGYLEAHAWAEVFMDEKWYAVDPTFNEIGFIDSGHLSVGYGLSTLESSYFSAEGYSIYFNNYTIYYPDLKVISTTSTLNIQPIINITPKWRVTNVSGNTVTYEITGIFNNSRGTGN